MSKKLRILLGGIIALLLAIGIFTFVTSTKDTHETQTIEQQRETHAKLIENSPFKETLTWDKRSESKQAYRLIAILSKCGSYLLILRQGN